MIECSPYVQQAAERARLSSRLRRPKIVTVKRLEGDTLRTAAAVAEQRVLVGVCLDRARERRYRGQDDTHALELLRFAWSNYRAVQRYRFRDRPALLERSSMFVTGPQL